MPSRSNSDADSQYSRRSSGSATARPRSATARPPERRSSRDSRGSRGSKEDRGSQRGQSSRRSEGSTRSGGSACSGASRRSSSASTKMRRNQSSLQDPIDFPDCYKSPARLVAGVLTTSPKGSAPESDSRDATNWISPPGTKIVGGYYDHEMPGYSGHRPGVNSGNGGCGKTIGKAEKRAAVELAIYKRGDVPDFRPPARWISDDHYLYGPGSAIPGYQGHVPGVRASNLFAISLCKAAKDNWHAGLDGPRRRKPPEDHLNKMKGSCYISNADDHDW